ncbi:MAG TPA: DUF4389 domain-containing protein [Candidatus Nanopelagicaceae bacterium]
MGTHVTTKIEIQIMNRNQMTSLFRGILVIPIAFYASSFGSYASDTWDSSRTYYSGIFVFPVVLALLFCGVYPSYILQFNKAMLGLAVRIAAYFLLLTDEYPSIESNEKIGIEFPEIDGGKTLSRGMPLVKWFLAIPLYVVGCFYGIYALMLTFVAWITIVFTCKYPEWCAAGVVGTIAYWNRVSGYAFVLVTDDYPSFTL